MDSSMQVRASSPRWAEGRPCSTRAGCPRSEEALSAGVAGCPSLSFVCKREAELRPEKELSAFVHEAGYWATTPPSTGRITPVR